MITPQRILVIRRDNIGDLICTTPMLHRLREAYPKAWIGVLANRYNAAVLAGNPDIDKVFAYQKAKHRPPGLSRWAVWMETARMLWQLRRLHLDLVIIASPGGARFARWLAPRYVLADKGEQGHEVERCLHLLAPLGLDTAPGNLVLHAPLVTAAGKPPRKPIVGFHLSARKPQQRWPADACTEFILRLITEEKIGEVRLFWAPGASDDPHHPGDDAKLKEVLAKLDGLPVVPYPSKQLEELIAGIATCDLFVCSDGGAMHIAAGLGKPILCFFGNSGTERWRPWGVAQTILQPSSLNVADISPADAIAGFRTVARQFSVEEG